ncbi:hypothetical protein DPMN_027777 [Dreissena polymorpha]|uniref:Uncharacterized protein n=1 Tax=Dreissena polymorpha TaxID=45954 RepID=A0A9D4RDR9_DREPO|nr:hypothetical protein DPMN_027777 [Dreissena polymorpha]
MSYILHYGNYGWTSMAAFFLVHTMCWRISLLALACAWDKGLYSTIKKQWMDTSGYLLLGTFYLLVYFSTSTCLCLGQEATFNNTETMGGPW